MPYSSQITFTLDTICPWTYLAKKRLSLALSQYRDKHPDCTTSFHIKFLPYQLYPEASKDGEDKFLWYKGSKYGDSDEKMKAYTTIMSAYGRSAGIEFKFGGVVANTMDAHRVIYYFQEQRGEEVAEKLVMSLYKQYFEEERHPSSVETLLRACRGAGVDEEEARRVVEDEGEGLMELKGLIREQEGNGIDAVPFVVVEGRKRDVSLQGAKDVGEYLKVLEQIARESS